VRISPRQACLAPSGRATKGSRAARESHHFDDRLEGLSQLLSHTDVHLTALRGESY
jgi:hypothetical protein